MDKGTIIEQTHLKVLGGIKGEDARRKVHIDEVRTYVEAAIRYVFKKHYWEYKQSEGVLGMDETGLRVYEVTVMKNKESGFYEAQLPVRVLSLPGGTAIESVTAPEGIVNFVRVRGQMWLDRSESFGDVSLWWPEGDKVILTNLGVTKELKVTAIPDPASLTDDDELNVPGGTEVEIIDMAVRFFLEQRQTIGDTTIDNNEADHRTQYRR